MVMCVKLPLLVRERGLFWLGGIWGGQALPIAFALIETAKVNGVVPQDWFPILIVADLLTCREVVLPWRHAAQQV